MDRLIYRAVGLTTFLAGWLVAGAANGGASDHSFFGYQEQALGCASANQRGSAEVGRPERLWRRDGRRHGAPSTIACKSNERSTLRIYR